MNMRTGQRGRPSRVYEKNALRIFHDAVNDARFREIVLHAFMGARGFRPVFKEDGTFKGYEPDEKSTPRTRLEYQELIMQYKMGKPVTNITFEDDGNPTFDDYIRTMERDKFQTIVDQAEDLLKKKTIENG